VSTGSISPSGSSTQAARPALTTLPVVRARCRGYLPPPGRAGGGAAGEAVGVQGIERPAERIRRVVQRRSSTTTARRYGQVTVEVADVAQRGRHPSCVGHCRDDHSRCNMDDSAPVASTSAAPKASQARRKPLPAKAAAPTLLAADDVRSSTSLTAPAQ
jgi:hypothetical protein